MFPSVRVMKTWWYLLYTAQLDKNHKVEPANSFEAVAQSCAFLQEKTQGELMTLERNIFFNLVTANFKE